MSLTAQICMMLKLFIKFFVPKSYAIYVIPLLKIGYYTFRWSPTFAILLIHILQIHVE